MPYDAFEASDIENKSSPSGLNTICDDYYYFYFKEEADRIICFISRCCFVADDDLCLYV